MSNECGTLYVVATPIGNLEDLSRRAERVLATVDYVAAEDTRHSRVLLQHYGIRTPLLSLHEHNEAQRVDSVLELLVRGESVALVSDAGTPLISDPGYRLVREARRRGLQVVPVPGPSSLVAALSVAGLPTDRFAFEGFLPAKPAQRRRRLEELVAEPRTLVFFEASHRIVASVEDMAAIFGTAREAAIARELTKAFETVLQGSLGELLERLNSDPDQTRGEFVVMVAGAPEAVDDDEAKLAEADRILKVLLEELPLKQAAKLAAKLTGVTRNVLYERGLGFDGTGRR